MAHTARTHDSLNRVLAPTTDPDAVDTALGLVVLTNEQYLTAVGDRLHEAARFPTDPDDAEVLLDAKALTAIRSDADYAAGWTLLTSIDSFKKRATAHYMRWKRPVKFLHDKVLTLEHEHLDERIAVRAALAKRLTTYKAEKDRLARLEQQRQQAEADAAARRIREEEVAALRRVAEAEAEPSMSAAFTQQAEAMAALPVIATEVLAAPATPKVRGHFRTTWHAQVDDVRVLLAAWLAGTCHLDETALTEACAAQLHSHAVSMHEQIGLAYPGVSARSIDTPVTK